jgi:hypothetical protein
MGLGSCRWRIGSPADWKTFEVTVLHLMYCDKLYKQSETYKAKQATYSAEQRKTETWKERTRRNAREYRAKIRAEVIAAYGSKCSCSGCDIVDPRFLTLDHVNDDGAEHRKLLNAGSQVYLWAKRNGYPDSLRLFCWNCNCARQ